MVRFFKNKKIDDKIPDNFVIKCKHCQEGNFKTVLIDNFYICTNCNKNLSRPARNVIADIVDEKTFREFYASKKVVNPIAISGYEDKQKELKKQLDIDEAVICGIGKIGNIKTAIAVMDTRYLMGSLGTRAGEKITQLIELATKHKLPLIIFTASGGARMQEGILSLMQMSKIVSALTRHDSKGLFYMPILMDPTTGGVSASFAMIGDVIIAEDDALICFAGPKVIEKTINQTLPHGFQRSEFLLKNGFLDKIVKREDQREFIITMLRIHGGENE